MSYSPAENFERAVVIDAHQHYYQLANFDYSWISPSARELYQDRMPGDIYPQMRAAGVDQVVLVQAAQNVAESRWMLDLAARTDQIVGVVGWVNLATAPVAETVAEFAANPLLKGFRPPMPGPDADWSLLDGGLRALAAHNLACDLLPSSAAAWVRNAELADRHPDVTFALDHLARPAAIRPGSHAAWKEGVAPLAARPNMVMKLSGYLSLAEPKPVAFETVLPFFEIALELFGADRLMFATDWPVCTLGGRYADSVNLLRTFTQTLSQSEQSAIWGGTAARVYRLDA